MNSNGTVPGPFLQTNNMIFLIIDNARQKKNEITSKKYDRFPSCCGSSGVSAPHFPAQLETPL